MGLPGFGAIVENVPQLCNIGHRGDQFLVQFDADVTDRAGAQRVQMSEVGLYTVANGKIVQEEFLYLMAES